LRSWSPTAAMAFGKEIKTKQYFKRYQVKFRRRREGKTDYKARAALVIQDKNKYNSPKYRFVVRFTNKDIICQIIYATLAGDKTVCAAYAHELPKYGLEFGLTNYAAAYCTGLLLARRVLTKFGLDETYEGKTELDGEDYHVEPEGDARPFRALLDVGLKRTSTGAKVFGALKGAVDGGLDIPHNEKRYAGYDKDSKSLDPEMHMGYITGQHVCDHAESMEEEEPEKYAAHFSKMIDAGIEAADLEDLYPQVHEKIREDPTHEKKARSESGGKQWRMKKITYEERKAAMKAKLAALKEAAMDDDDDDDEDED